MKTTNQRIKDSNAGPPHPSSYCPCSHYTEACVPYVPHVARPVVHLRHIGWAAVQQHEMNKVMVLNRWFNLTQKKKAYKCMNEGRLIKMVRWVLYYYVHLLVVGILITRQSRRVNLHFNCQIFNNIRLPTINAYFSMGFSFFFKICSCLLMFILSTRLWYQCLFWEFRG